MDKDNWKHRSVGMRCQTCMYFVEKKGQPPDYVTSDPADERYKAYLNRRPFGRCRRHAPTMGGWPAVFGDDWCGDHKLDESRLGGE